MIIKCRTDNDQKYQKNQRHHICHFNCGTPFYTPHLYPSQTDDPYIRSQQKRNKRKCRIFLKTFPDQHVSCKHCCQNICPDKEIQHIPKSEIHPRHRDHQTVTISESLLCQSADQKKHSAHKRACDH